MTSPVRAAVVGTGYLGKFHAQKYARLPEAELVYCVDSDAERGRAAIEGAGGGAKLVSDYHEILGKVDAVSIAVPTPMHYRVAKDFLEAGCHILLEKPVTETVAEAEELVKLAAAKNLVFMVGHLERFNPAVMRLRNTLVKPAYIQSERLGGFKERAANVDVVLDLMIHDLDIVLSFVKSPISRVHAIGVPILSDKIDLASARLEFQNGAVANFTASRVSIGDSVRKIKIFQHENYISIDYQNQRMAVFTLGPGDPANPMSRIRIEEIKLDRQDALELEIKAFLESVRNHQPPPVTGEEGKRALAVALQVLESIRRTPRPEDLG